MRPTTRVTMLAIVASLPASVLCGCAPGRHHADVLWEGVALPPRTAAPDPFLDPTRGGLAFDMSCGDRIGMQLAARQRADAMAPRLVHEFDSGLPGE